MTSSNTRQNSPLVAAVSRVRRRATKQSTDPPRHLFSHILIEKKKIDPPDFFQKYITQKGRSTRTAVTQRHNKLKILLHFQEHHHHDHGIMDGATTISPFFVVDDDDPPKTFWNENDFTAVHPSIALGSGR